MPWYGALIILAWLFLLAGCRLWWRAVLEHETLLRRAVPASTETGEEQDRLRAYRPIFRAMSAFGQTYIARSGESIGLALRRAGDPLLVTAQEWVGLRLTCAAAGLLFGLLISFVGGGLILPLILLLGGFFGPELWLRSKAARRQTELVGAVPPFLDTLATCLKAGVPLEAALERVSQSLGGPLGEEWQRTMRAIRLQTPSAVAYRSLAERIQSEDVDVLVQSLLQADAMGVAVADTLRQQARILRMRHRDRVREQAAKAGPKISLITTMLTAPSVFLFILALTILSLASGGFGIQGLF